MTSDENLLVHAEFQHAYREGRKLSPSASSRLRKVAELSIVTQPAVTRPSAHHSEKRTER